MTHLTELDKELIKARIEAGVPKTRIAKEIGVNVMTIHYHSNPEFKQKNKLSAKKWATNNKAKLTKIQAFSLLRKCLRQGWIVEPEVIQVIRQVELEKANNQ